MRKVHKEPAKRVTTFDHGARENGKRTRWGNIPEGERQGLAAEENDEVVEPGAADRGDRVVAQFVRQIDARNFRADRPGEGVDSQRIAAHQPAVLTV